MLVRLRGCGLCVREGEGIYLITKDRYDFDPVWTQSSLAENLEIEMAVLLLECHVMLGVICQSSNAQIHLQMQ